jgi:glycosyltransferase involved in cell wall biosynthesis
VSSIVAAVSDRIRSVLHVLPHPGGGGETYVNLLTGMDEYRFERIYLAPSRERLTAVPALATAVPRANLRSRRFDLMHVHGETASLLCLPGLASRSSIVSLHGLSFVRRSNGLAHRIAIANLRLLVRAANTTICVSHEERNEVLGVVSPSVAHKLALLPYGVPLSEPATEEERREVRRDLGVTDDAVVAITVGVLEYPKDPISAARAAVEAARSGRPIVLLVAGDGRLRPQLEQVARDADGAVRLLGQRSDVPRLLASADVFVLSSRHEGLPFALLEAMAAGVPPVVSDYPGANEAVGDAGIVVPHGDVESLTAALSRLADDPPYRAKLARRARARAETNYSLDDMLESAGRAYERALSRSK